MRKGTKSFVILGGGTAGWIAANRLATHWQDRDLDITLVESPDIGIIGVGEGSTPPLKIFLDFIGVEESDRKLMMEYIVLFPGIARFIHEIYSGILIVRIYFFSCICFIF